ncbi:MAG: 30S ribosomal protein S12 methylthiotransferase RimO [Lentisphaerae bacterium]|nr:30S ribosomal protein S12 methylthiotransferase RimO [Lentisphaerota bacterium]
MKRQTHASGRNKRKNNRPSVGFVSLGCAKNLVDSEIMATHIINAGYTLAPSAESADVILINTCSFIHDAREESYDFIKWALSLKEERSVRLVVAGCLSQRYKEKLLHKFPGIDALVGLDQLTDIPGIINEILTGTQVMNVSDEAVQITDPPMPRAVFTGAPYAYLKIADGCNHRCAFCAIPHIRGRYRSRKITSIVQEADNLLKSGIKELNLVSQDSMSFGKDLNDGSDLCALLRALSEIDGDFWVRVLYGHPSYLTEKLLDTMAELPKVCKYLDIPIQHSDPHMLNSMGRKGSPEFLLNLLDKIRSRMPGVAIRTTCLVGFPGETEEMHENLISFVKQAQFDHLGVFAYSHEENTPAYLLTDNIPDSEKQSRLDAVFEAQTEVIDLKAKGLTGKTMEVLVDAFSDDSNYDLLARSYRQAPEVDGNIIILDSVDKLKPGGFTQVTITEQVGCDMEAILSKH